MPAVLLSPSARAVAAALHVERTDITFATLTPERVAIAITVRNDSDLPSAATVALVQAAPLGAFVPWRPLAALPVPALEPDESVVLRLEARRAPAVALGTPDRLPPQRLLTALASADDDRDRAAAQARARAPGGGRNLAGGVTLATDVFELIGRTNPIWAGNLNIFVGGRAVERHLAQALRIYPGRVNAAMFVVGSGPDQYCFSLTGDGAAWNATLYDLAAQASLAPDVRRTEPVALNHWVPVERTHLLMLAMEPPATCRRGTVEVHVEQRSTGQTAIVEFSLDATAAGPGCYVVA